MDDMKAQTSTGHEGGLPRPHRGSRWRWSRPRQAMAAGGVLAAVLGLGVATGAGAGAATPTSGNSGAAAHGAPPGGMARPTVSGRITALSGDDITVETNAQTTVTVVYSSSTTFKTNPAPSGGTASSASALKVGDFIGVTGTKNERRLRDGNHGHDRPAASDGQRQQRWQEWTRRRNQGRQATIGCPTSCVTTCPPRSAGGRALPEGFDGGGRRIHLVPPGRVRKYENPVLACAAGPRRTHDAKWAMVLAPGERRV